MTSSAGPAAATLSVVRGRISGVRQNRIVRRWAGVPVPAAAVGVVLVCDALANGYSNYVLSPASGITLGRVAVVVIAALAVAVVAAAPWSWRRG